MTDKKKFSKIIEQISDNIIRDIQDHSLIGLGSGSTVATFVRRLGKVVKDKGIEISVIPSSLQIQLIAEYEELNIANSNIKRRIDFTIDGADQVDKKLNMIKGGGGALHREMILLGAAKNRIILIDQTKYVATLSRSVPLEISYFARNFVFDALKRIGGKPTLRLLDKGYPFVTENNNIIIDSDFGIINNPEKLRSKISNIPGIVEIGLFINKCDVLYIANSDGTINCFKQN